MFYGKGEACAAGSRLFVEKKIHDDFMHKLVDRAKKGQPGDPLDPKTRFGALVSERQMHTVLGYIEKGKAEGARLVAGGERTSTGKERRGGDQTTRAMAASNATNRASAERVYARRSPKHRASS